MPCFASVLCRAVPTSVSRVWTIASRSTTVTFDPRRRQTEPISSPIYPPPTTTMLRHFRQRQRAGGGHVLPSISTPGSGATSEPVAIRIFFAAGAGTAVVSHLDLAELGDFRRAGDAGDLVLLEQEPDALVRSSTTLSLRAISVFRSSSTLPTFTPCSARWSWASSNFSDECSALDGMQPMFVAGAAQCHACRYMRFSGCWAARIAAT